MSENRHQPQRLLAGALMGAVVLALAGGGTWLLIRSTPEAERSQAHALRPRVETVTAQPSIEALRWVGHGRLQPAEVLTIRAEVSGRIAADHERLRIGQEIPAGAAVLQIVSDQVEREHAAARAAVAEAEARIAERETSHRNEVELLEIERQRLAIADDLLAAERALLDQNGTSRRQVDAREQERLRALAEVARLAGAVAVHEPRLRALVAAREGAQARLAEAEALVAKTTWQAPWPAVVSTVAVEPGDAVSPGQHLATLVGRGPGEVEVGILPGVLARLTGAPAPPVGELVEPLSAEVEVAHGAGVVERRAARLLRSEPALHADTGELVLAGALTADDPRPLHRASFARVVVAGREVEAIRLPAEALLDDGGLWVVVDSRLEHRRPEILFDEGSRLVVSPDDAALRAGDRVVVTYLEDAFAGMTVTVRDDEAGAGAEE